MRVLIINDTTTWHHFGCAGTSIALKMEIESLGFELSTFSALNCAALDSLPTTSTEFFDQNILANFVAHNPKLCALIRANDIVVINGQGSLHGVEKEALALLYIVYISKTVFCKNVQIINHSVYLHDTLDAPDSEVISLYKKAYAVADFVAIREPLSAALMRSAGLEVHDSFDCLPLYIKQYYQPNLCNRQSDLILVAGAAAWLNLNILTPSAQAEVAVEKNGLIQMLKVLQLKMMEGYTVKFLYSELGYPAKDEQQMLSFLKGYMGKSFAVINVRTIDAWLKTISMSNLLISGGFHHCIAAACLGTRFIALNNTPKMTGLMKALEHPKPLIYSDPNLENKLRKAISRSAICTNSAQMLDNLCTKAQNNFTMLRKLSRF